MPLVRAGKCVAEAHSFARPELFRGARAPEAACAGLLLFFDCWDDAHDRAQEIETAEGSYWHAIIHRQEPDAGNSSYWFQRAGQHPVFTQIHDDAAEILARYPGTGWDIGKTWDPLRFIGWCEQARSDDRKTAAASEIQHREWVRLFEWCASQ